MRKTSLVIILAASCHSVSNQPISDHAAVAAPGAPADAASPPPLDGEPATASALCRHGSTIELHGARCACGEQLACRLVRREHDVAYYELRVGAAAACIDCMPMQFAHCALPSAFPDNGLVVIEDAQAFVLPADGKCREWGPALADQLRGLGG